MSALLFSVLEGKSKLLEKSITLLVRVGRSHKSDIHAHELGYRVDVDLRENDLLRHTQSVVAATVELALDTLEVADTGKSDTNESLEELIHLLTTEGHHNADRHLLAKLEVRDVLA